MRVDNTALERSARGKRRSQRETHDEAKRAGTARGFEDNYDKRAMEGWELERKRERAGNPKWWAFIGDRNGSVDAGQPHPYRLPPYSLVQYTYHACALDLSRVSTFPPLLAFDFANSYVRITSSININVNEAAKTHKLRDIIYYGHNHFVSRIITGTDQVWFHDGITTGSQTLYEG